MQIITIAVALMTILGVWWTLQGYKSQQCGIERSFAEETGKEITYITQAIFYDIGLAEGACYPQDGKKYLPLESQIFHENYVALRKNMESFRERMKILADKEIVPEVNEYISASSKLITHCTQIEPYDALRRNLEFKTCELINAIKEGIFNCTGNKITNPCGDG